MNRIRQVDKPWGFEIWLAHTDSYAGKLIHIERGHRLSLQYHRQKDESCYLLSGRVQLVKGPSLGELSGTELHPGACWRNHPGELHTVQALETSLVIEASTPQLDDVVRLIDDYGREPDVVPHAEELPPAPARLLDLEQLAGKLHLQRAELADVLNEPGFPRPIGRFRDRMLWEELAVEGWRHRP